MSALGLREIARKWFGISGGFSVVRDIFGVPKITGTQSLRARLDAAMKEPRRITGDWQVLPQQSQVLAMHAALLHTGRVLFFGGSARDASEHHPGPSGWDKTRLWDPTTGSVSYVSSPPYDLFCAGHAFLGDGQLVVAGGTEAYPPQAGPIHGPHGHLPGLRNTTLFRDTTAGPASWIPAAEMHREPNRATGGYKNNNSGGRWYPTLLTLADGRVLAMAGHPASEDLRHSNFMVELFDSFGNQWNDVGDEPQSVINAVTNRPDQKPEIYPRLHLLPDGSVFCVALADERSYFWHPMVGFTPLTGTVPPEMRLSRNYDLNFWGSVLLPLRPSEGYAGRILVAGGMSQPYTIAPRAPNPLWQPTQSRQGFSGTPPIRDFASLVLLPDGNVLMVGGTQDMMNDQHAVLEAEQYNPGSGIWTKLAPAKVPRQYHSTALLLPDGRVWTAGSNKNFGTEREYQMEAYSPPYLFRGARPVITSTPSALTLASNFTIGTQEANSIRSVALVRGGSSTHSFDADQRYVGLVIQGRTATSVTVTSPPDHNIAPPGYYMLFIVNNNGVPSTGRFVRVQ
jgi:hypothetical protein